MTETKNAVVDDPNALPENSTYENVQDAIHGVDEPMEDSHPTTTGVMVYGAYPLLLLIALIVAFAVAGLTGFF